MQLDFKQKLNNIVFYILQPIEKELLALLKENIEMQFNAECQIQELSLDVSFAYSKIRKQYNSTSILAVLKPITKTQSLAITDKDLYTSNSTFVFGEAEVGGRVGIVSFARLKTNVKETFYSLAYKEVTHELGHIFGLRHCDSCYCVMNFSRDLEEVAEKSAKFCPDCAHSLAYLVLYN
jgi:archaemetzincin